MKQPIMDKAEVSIDFPDKFYVGAFGRGSTFDVAADSAGIHLHLERGGDERRRFGFHLHYPLLAEILTAAAEALRDAQGVTADDAARMQAAATALAQAATAARAD